MGHRHRRRGYSLCFMAGKHVELIRKPHDLEWPSSLSRQDLLDMHWTPVPIHQFVLKIHSRCNLACDYCYIYEMADTSWRDEAASMSLEVVRQSAKRIAEHARAHQLETVSIVLHGGEPLLVGEQRLFDMLRVIEETLLGVTEPDFGMQTNGMLLTNSVLEILNGFDVGIGVSMDGGREQNDRHRRRRNGTGTYDVVADRLRALQAGPYAAQFNGLLATIDVANDPVQTYNELRSFDPPAMNFLLPHANWTMPPPALDLGGDETPYADWLIGVFDAWFPASRPKPSVQLFDQIIRLLNGEQSTTELVGLASLSVATITTDGAYELADNLKSSFDRAAHTGMNVFDHDFDALMPHPSVAARQLGANALCTTCIECPLGMICGGGLYTHRYRQGAGYRNPSVYCRDLFRLISHIRRSLGTSN
jgi:uncharacterized protein